MKKILLCPNPERDIDFALTKKVYRMLKDAGCRPYICSLFAQGEEDIGEHSHPYVLNEDMLDSEMIITFGGDGTLLHASRAAATHRIPVLGVNLGNKGFMTDIERNEIELVMNVVTGDFKINKRMMLDVSVMRGGETIVSDFAINDVVIGGMARTINLSVFGDGSKIFGFSGDGIVVATPTGSTAYSMAAGGPIVEPTAENIIVTPICAHVLIAKSFVLAPERVVTLKIGALHGKSAYMSVDGEPTVPLKSGDMIKVCRSQLEAQLVHVADTSFYDKVSKKLGEVK